MMLKSKKVYFFICIVLILVLFGCQSRVRIQLDLSSLLSADNIYCWPGVNYEMTMDEAEAATAYEFPEVPYTSSYGERLRADFDNKAAYDYRNGTEYDSAVFPAMKDGKSVLVEYGDAVGNLLYEFSKGKLRTVYVFFGSSSSVHDENIDYGGKKNNAKVVYDQIKADLTEHYGTPQEQKTETDHASCTWKIYLNEEKTAWTIVRVLYEKNTDSGERTRFRVGYFEQE